MSRVIDAQAGAGVDGAAMADLFDPQNAVGVVRYKGAIHWCLSAHDNWVIDWTHGGMHLLRQDISFQRWVPR